MHTYSNSIGTSTVQVLDIQLYRLYSINYTVEQHNIFPPPDWLLCLPLTDILIYGVFYTYSSINEKYILYISLLQ